MADETLRECPACRQSRPYYDSETRGGVTLYAVACNICGHRTGWHSTRAIADTGWNTRVTDPALAAAQAEVAEAKAALERTNLAGIDADFTGVADAIGQMAQHIKEQAAEVTRLTAELASAKETIRVCTRTIVRAEALWKAQHQDSEFYPDVPDLVVWLKEQVDALKERRCETCRWCKEPKSVGLVCYGETPRWCDKLEAMVSSASQPCAYYEPKEAPDA